MANSKWFSEGTRSFWLGLIIALVSIAGYGFNLGYTTEENKKDIAENCKTIKTHKALIQEMSTNQTRLITLMEAVKKGMADDDIRERSDAQRLRQLEIDVGRLVNGKNKSGN